MSPITLATAREIVAAGSLRGAELLGRPGGYLVLFKIGMQTRTLVTRAGAPRIFGSLDAAMRVMRSIGVVTHIEINAADYAPAGPLARRRRPDRSQALRQLQNT